MTAEQELELLKAGKTVVEIEAIKNASNNKVGIKVSAMQKGNEMWDHTDMLGKTFAVSNVSLGTTKKGNACFDITVDGRKDIVKVMPKTALQSGLAVVDAEDDIVITAKAVRGIEGIVFGAKGTELASA